MKKHSGFTIVEMMMVIAILAVLMTMVTTAAGSAIRQARAQKADALVKLVQQGIATYYAQKDEWPGNWYSDSISGNQSNDSDTYVLTDAQVDQCIRAVVQASIKTSPMMDVSRLFVCNNPNGNKASGRDFIEAIHGSKRNPKKMKVSEMSFGYPEEKHGYFRRFKISYSIPTDTVIVSQQ